MVGAERVQYGKSRSSVNERKLVKRLHRNCGKAITDFNMIESGDVVMVCVSGGKDSFTMLDLLMRLQEYAPIDFKVIGVHLYQNQPGFPLYMIEDWFKRIGVEYDIIDANTYQIVEDKIEAGKTKCSLCSRLRRGHLYSYARRHGIDKIALGHHRDDMLETMFMNIFHGGKMATMPAKLISDDAENIVIRPLAYCKEADIIKYAHLSNFPIVPCGLCSNQKNLERARIKVMLQEWDKEYPMRMDSIFRALQNVKTSHMLDRSLYNFGDLKINGDI